MFVAKKDIVGICMKAASWIKEHEVEPESVRIAEYGSEITIPHAEFCRLFSGQPVKSTPINTSWGTSYLLQKNVGDFVIATNTPISSDSSTTIIL